MVIVVRRIANAGSELDRVNSAELPLFCSANPCTAEMAENRRGDRGGVATLFLGPILFSRTVIPTRLAGRTPG